MFRICVEHRENVSRTVQYANDHHRIGVEFEENGVTAVDTGANAVTQFGAFAIAGRVEGNALTLCSQLTHKRRSARGVVGRDEVGNGFEVLSASGVKARRINDRLVLRIWPRDGRTLRRQI